MSMPKSPPRSLALRSIQIFRQMARQSGLTFEELLSQIQASSQSGVGSPTTRASEIAQMAITLDELVSGIMMSPPDPQSQYGEMGLLPPALLREFEEQRALTNELFARADLSHLTHLTSRVVHASIMLSSAFAKAGVDDFDTSSNISSAPQDTASEWYSTVVNSSLARLNEVRTALLHPWTAEHWSNPLVFGAFIQLADLTPARAQLLDLCALDRPRAFSELVKHLDLIGQQFSLTAQLVGDVGPVEVEALRDGARFEAQLDRLLRRAGETLSLTQAAKRLEITRQALHQRIQKGSALGVMRNGELVVPSCQLVENREGTTSIVPNLQTVLSPFLTSKAGAVSALQFLLDEDPELGVSPIDALKAGRLSEVQQAVAMVLGLAET